MNMHWTDGLPHKASAASGDSPNVGNTERVLSGLAAAWFLRKVIKGHGISRFAYLMPAVASFKRAFTGRCEAYRAMGLSSVAEGVGNRTPALQQVNPLR